MPAFSRHYFAYYGGLRKLKRPPGYTPRATRYQSQ